MAKGFYRLVIACPAIAAGTSSHIWWAGNHTKTVVIRQIQLQWAPSAATSLGVCELYRTSSGAPDGSGATLRSAAKKCSAFDDSAFGAAYKAAGMAISTAVLETRALAIWALPLGSTGDLLISDPVDRPHEREIALRVNEGLMIEVSGIANTPSLYGWIDFEER